MQINIIIITIFTAIQKMSRYCFNVYGATGDTLRELRQYFKDTTATKITFEGGVACLQATPEDILKLTEHIAEMSNVLNFTTSIPQYVPHWTEITQVGPFYPDIQDPYQPVYADLIDKRNNKRYKLNPSEEHIASLYASRLLLNRYVDDEFNANFWEDFQEFLRPGQPFTSFDQIDWSDMKEKLKERLQTPPEVLQERKEKYGHVFIDGSKEYLDTYSVPPTALFFGGVNNPLRGKIKHGIIPSDVTLNLSPNVNPTPKGYKKEYAPSTSWAVRWTDPLTDEIHTNNVIFTPPEVFSESGDESDYGSSFEGEVEGEESEGSIDYGEEEEEEAEAGEEEAGEPEEVIEPGEVRGGAGVKPYIYRPKRTKVEKIVIQPGELLDLSGLSMDERLLPFSYLVSKLEQWQILDRACKSGWTLVNNLPKVSDEVLKEFADIVSYGSTHILKFALKDDPTLPKVNAILEYARQRDV